MGWRIRRNGPLLTIPRFAGNNPKLRPRYSRETCPSATPTSSTTTAQSHKIPCDAAAGLISVGVIIIAAVDTTDRTVIIDVVGGTRTSDRMPINPAPATQIQFASPLPYCALPGLSARKNKNASPRLDARWRSRAASNADLRLFSAVWAPDSTAASAIPTPIAIADHRPKQKDLTIILTCLISSQI